VSAKNTVNEIKFSLDFGTKRIAIGHLDMRERKVYFEYERSFIELNLEIRSKMIGY
jgi:serine/threonine-protein kinase HipA